MGYLLDTKVVSDLVRDPHGRVTQRIRETGDARAFTSIIVAAELRYGAARKGSPRLTSQVEAVLRALEILPFEAPADAIYTRIRAGLERAGRPIEGNDLLIAAHALTLRHTLVTDNERELARVEGLACENWLRLA